MVVTDVMEQQPSPAMADTLIRAAAVLSLPVELIDDRGAVRRAWRSTALVTHPDAGGNAIEFAAAADAYRTLCAPRPQEVAAAMQQGQAADATRPAPVVRRWVWTVSVRWPVAIVGTSIAGLLVVLVVVTGAESVAPLVVYLCGWAAYSWWHAAGRPRRIPLRRE